MVDDADEDASGSVNFQEFVTLMLKRQEGGQTREEIKQVCSISSVQVYDGMTKFGPSTTLLTSHS